MKDFEGLTFCCSQLVHERVEQGVTQEEAEKTMPNMFKDKEEEKKEVCGLMTVNDYIKARGPPVRQLARSTEAWQTW